MKLLREAGPWIFHIIGTRPGLIHSREKRENPESRAGTVRLTRSCSGWRELWPAA